MEHRGILVHGAKPTVADTDTWPKKVEARQTHTMKQGNRVRKINSHCTHILCSFGCLCDPFARGS